MHTGSLIRDARQEAGLSRKDVAERLDISVQALGQIERARSVTTATLERLAGVFPLPPIIFSGIETPSQAEPETAGTESEEGDYFPKKDLQAGEIVALGPVELSKVDADTIEGLLEVLTEEERGLFQECVAQLAIAPPELRRDLFDAIHTILKLAQSVTDILDLRKTGT